MGKKKIVYAEAFRALSNPSRLRIFETIRAGHKAAKSPKRCRPDDVPTDSVCVCEINEKMKIGAPTISHHLKELRNAGLVDVLHRGQWSYYTVSKGALSDLKKYFND